MDYSESNSIIMQKCKNSRSRSLKYDHEQDLMEFRKYHPVVLKEFTCPNGCLYVAISQRQVELHRFSCMRAPGNCPICKKKVLLIKLLEHVDECKEAVLCPQCRTVSRPWAELNTHIADECSQTLIPCPICHTRHIRCSMPQHMVSHSQ